MQNCSRPCCPVSFLPALSVFIFEENNGESTNQSVFFSIVKEWLFWYFSLFYIPQITSGYFTWTDGPPTLSNVDIKIPFGERQATWTCHFSSSPNLFPYQISICYWHVHWLTQYQTSQVSWLWLWARWVVENHLCCWQRWERCREYQEQSPGTGQLQVHWLFTVCKNQSVPNNCFKMHQILQWSIVTEYFDQIWLVWWQKLKEKRLMNKSYPFSPQLLHKKIIMKLFIVCPDYNHIHIHSVRKQYDTCGLRETCVLYVTQFILEMKFNPKVKG